MFLIRPAAVTVDHTLSSGFYLIIHFTTLIIFDIWCLTAFTTRVNYLEFGLNNCAFQCWWEWHYKWFHASINWTLHMEIKGCSMAELGNHSNSNCGRMCSIQPKIILHKIINYLKCHDIFVLLPTNPMKIPKPTSPSLNAFWLPYPTFGFQLQPHLFLLNTYIFKNASQIYSFI